MTHTLAGLAGGTLVGVLLSVALFALSALLIGTVASAAGQLLALTPWTDPVYTHAALRSLADIHIAGVGFADTATAPLIRVVLEPGSSVLARLLAAAVAQSAVLALGLLVFRAGMHRCRISLIVAGLAVQLQVALGLVLSLPSLPDLETIGLSFAFNACLPWVAGRRLVISDLVSSVPSPMIVAALVAIALVRAYVLAALVAAFAICIQRRVRLDRLLEHRPPSLAASSSAVLASGMTTVLLVALSALVAACRVVPLPSVDPTLLSDTQAMATVAAAPTAVAESHAASQHRDSLTRLSRSGVVGDRWFAEPATPSRVEVVSIGTGFEYLVNGSPQVIHGMGVNTQYQTIFSAEERRSRLDADMAEMHDLGINTLVGWDPAEFDDVLLDAAQRHAIGVVLPFDLRPDADYTDPRVRAELTGQVLTWVDRYRHHPALRMWGLGNEVLHKIVHPAWVGPQDPQREAEARAFSDWLVKTADAIHAADPDHPVTYRDAEDAFVSWVSDALQRHPARPRTWFVWGTNCYQDYLSSVVDGWPDQGTGLALWVSEFAPGGLAIPDRPAGFTQMWGYVRMHPEWVLGGAVYAWTRNGPEEIDRNLGLTDDGKPADGRSLDAIARFFTNPMPP